MDEAGVLMAAADLQDGDDVLAGIALGAASNGDQAWVRPMEIALLFKLSEDSLFRVFIIVHKAAGEGVAAL